MSTQPEALRLADELERYHGEYPTCTESAAELRRLHAQRDALLEVLEEALEVCIWPNAQVSGVEEKARAAIASVEEGK